MRSNWDDVSDDPGPPIKCLFIPNHESRKSAGFPASVPNVSSSSVSKNSTLIDIVKSNAKKNRLPELPELYIYDVASSDHYMTLGV